MNNTERMRECIDNYKEQLDRLNLPSIQHQQMDLFLHELELLMQERDSLYEAISIIKCGYSRMASIVGTEQDEEILETIDKILACNK